MHGSILFSLYLVDYNSIQVIVLCYFQHATTTVIDSYAIQRLLMLG